MSRNPTPARLSPALMDHAEERLAQLLRYEYSADSVVSHYFRANRMLGHADRGFIAETVFAALRYQRSLEARVGFHHTRQLLLATLVCARGMNSSELAPVLHGKEAEDLARFKAVDEASMPPKATQETFRRMVTERGMWSGAAVATQQDLSALFVARACELYLRKGGHFGFVLPLAALSRKQFVQASAQGVSRRRSNQRFGPSVLPGIFTK